MRIKDLPSVDRPREKLARYSSTSRLKDEELVAVILGTGRKGENVLQLAKRVVDVVRKHPHMESMTLDDLLQIKGVGKVKASQLLAAYALGSRLVHQSKPKTILSPLDIWEDLREIRSSKKEYLIGYYVDTQQAVIAKEVISVGTLNAGLVHPREVFEPAIRHSAAGVLLAHNHPSKNTTPSKQDELATKMLKEAGELLDIELIDHIIVSGVSYLSMKAENLL